VAGKHAGICHDTSSRFGHWIADAGDLHVRFAKRDVETGLRRRLLGHRQTKGAATDKPNLPLARHISTLPKL